MDEDDELPSVGGDKMRLKTIQKLSLLGSFFAEKDPGLSSFYISTADNIISTPPPRLTDSATKKPDHPFCPFCGTVFNAENVRVRHHAKRAPSSGRWANHLARGTISRSLAPATRARIERLANARNKTVITCLTCHKAETVMGVMRLPREERRRHQTLSGREIQIAEPVKKKKKKKRRKDPNAGLKISINANVKASSHRTQHVSQPSSSVTSTTKSSKIVQTKQTFNTRLKVSSGAGNLTTTPSAGKKTKKSPKQMMNQLQSLLAAQDKKAAKGTSLSLFLNQV